MPPIKEERIQQLNEQKLTKLINEGHLEYLKGRYKVVIPRHQVPKDVSDIPVLWNLTNNGVNPTVLSIYLSCTKLNRFAENLSQETIK